MFDVNIAVKSPYKATVFEAPAQAIIASMPEFAAPLVANTYIMALLLAKLRRSNKRLRFVEAKLTLGGYRLTVTPKGKLVHLLDMGVRPHSLAPKHPKLTAHPRTEWAMHPGFPGRHFMPAALQASLPEMQRVLDRNVVQFLAKHEAHE